MKLRSHSQTSVVEIWKWISNSFSHILSTLGIKLIRVGKKGSQLAVAAAVPVFNRLSQLLCYCHYFSVYNLLCGVWSAGGTPL